MSRVKGSTPTRDRRKKVLKHASGYFGSKHLLYKTAHEQVMHSWKYAWIHRRQLKRNMRKLWIARINAAARMNGMSYSRLMNGLKNAGVTVNRKMLSEIAISNPEDFAKICETAKKGKVDKPVKEEKAPKAEKPAKEDKKEAENAEEKPVKKTTRKKVVKVEE
ncbi:MAG: 50S ribosomal protein L20 [Erysipelotrichaceae bacterium]|nr:50S ribosomal protein L20 [Erysipelotrichaceae bacterium]MBQ5805194.1 50S ribosomal protein L20 [Erysipelotrichaceae bacterium]